MLHRLALAVAMLLGSAASCQPTVHPPRAAAAPEAPAPVPPPPRPTGPLRIGMNFTGLSYFSTEAPFIDRAKLIDWSGVPAANKDAIGFPNSMPAGQKRFGASINLDAGRDYVVFFAGSKPGYLWSYADEGARAGKNVLSWLGISNVKIAADRITFHADGPTILIEIWGLDPADPLRDVHLVRADQVAAWRAGAILNPEFTAAIGKHFSPHRYMDWGCTNGSTLVRWADRPKPTDASWNCAPAEVMVAEANASGADMWITLPAQADDDYVRQLATLVRDTLAPGRKLHLEYSNEVWNQQFSQSKWATAQGQARWGANTPLAAQIWYGYRAAQVMRIAHTVLGERMIGVYASFTGLTDPAINAAIDSGIARANVGKVPDLFQEYAIAPYFGGELSTAPGASDKDVAHVIALAKANDLDAAFRELEHGHGFDADFSLDNIARQWLPYHSAQARKRGLALVAYEGGFSSYWFGIGGNDPNQALVLGFMKKVAEDPRMGTLYTRMLKDFAAVGGSIFTHFNDVGGITIWGPWPVVPDLAASSPRLTALKAASGH